MGKTRYLGRSLLQVLPLILAVVPAGMCQQTETIEGTFAVFVEDRFDQHGSTYHYQLQTGPESVELTFPSEEDPRRIPPGSKISVTGVRSGQRFLIEPNGSTSAQGATASLSFSPYKSRVKVLVAANNSPPAVGVRNVAVILATFANDSLQIMDNASAQTALSQAESYYLEDSYRQLSMTGQVFGYFSLAMSEPCDSGSYIIVATAAVEALIKSGVDVSGFQSFVVIAPSGPACFVGAIASVGGLLSVPGVPGAAGLGMIRFNTVLPAWEASGALVHELGHNLGIAEAHAIGCYSGIYDPNTDCSTSKAAFDGDLFDAMGSGAYPNPKHFNAALKEFVGWSSPMSVTASNNYEVGPIEQLGPFSVGLKINPDGGSENYYVELRQPIGFDNSFSHSPYDPGWPDLSQGYQGALVHLKKTGDNTTYLLNMHPGVFIGTKFPTSPALMPGETYVDYQNRFSITTVSVSPAVMQVRILAALISSPALMFINPVEGSSVSGVVDVSIEALDRSGVVKVELYKDGTLLGTQTQLPYQFSWDASHEVSGIHTLTATAYNSSNNSYSQKITVNLNGACTAVVSPGGQAFSAAGAARTVSVSTSASCMWAASNPPSWITFTSAITGAGAGSVAYQVAANTSGVRSGTFIIAGQTFVVEQVGASTAGVSLTGSMAQLASGGGWDTTLTLVNTGVATGEALLNVLGNDGSPLQLPFTFSQVPSPAGPLVASTLDQPLNANSLLVLDSEQPGNPNTQTGSAQVLTNGSNIGGFAIFKYSPTGQEAVVPLETRNAPSYLLAFDNTGALGTGIAIANVATQSASIPIVIRDDTGRQLGTDTINLAAQGHTSFMLTGAYALTKNKRGTIQLNTPASGQISALGLRANGTALTTLPVLANVTAGGGSMAQIATGGGWQTTFTLGNTGTSSAQAQLSFFNNDGYPLSLPLTFVQTGAATTAFTINQTIAAGASLVVLANGGNPLVGAAQLTTTGNVGGFAIFRYNPTGQEAVVPLETRTASAYVLAFDNTNGLATGVALANVSNQAAEVPVVLRDDTGASLGTATINLASHGHTSFVLKDSYAFAAGKRGTMEFDTPAGGQISVLGLRATPTGAVTTIPVLAK